MNKPADAHAFDAALQQAEGGEKFSWSGFCKSGMIRSRAPVRARANHNQWAHAAKKLRSGNSSRRIEWRNSLWPQHFWCHLCQHSAQKKHPSQFSITSRFRPRFMLSQCRRKADTTDAWRGQGESSASATSAVLKQVILVVIHRMKHEAAGVNCLWSIRNASATVLTPCCVYACAETRLTLRVAPALSAISDNRSFQCQSSRSSLLSVQPWYWPLVRVRPQSQITHQCQHQSTWSQSAPKANTYAFTGQALASGPDTTGSTSYLGGQTC